MPSDARVSRAALAWGMANPMADDLVVARAEGLYCPKGDFYIDPWRPVDKAVITHGHGDHARRGHGHYLAHEDSALVLRTRLGADLPLQTVPYGEPVRHNGVRISLHPAGHVLGSAQVRYGAWRSRVGGVGRLQAGGRWHLRAVRACPL